MSIAIDAQGNKWFGTFGGGASKFDGANWTTYNTSNGLVSDNIYSVAIDTQGDKWFGTWNDGVSRMAGATWTTYTTLDGLAHNVVYVIAADTQGNKWFGTAAGLNKFDDTTWTTYATLDGLAHNVVNSIAFDAQGNNWIGAWGGVGKFNGTTWTGYTTADGLGGDIVDAVAVDAQGNKWFGTSSGGVSMLFDAPLFVNLPGTDTLINVYNGQVINQNPYILKVNPTSDFGIDRVEFFVDSAKIGTVYSKDSNADGTYSCPWDTSLYHSSVRVVAYGIDGQSSEISRTATVMLELPFTGK